MFENCDTFHSKLFYDTCKLNSITAEHTDKICNSPVPPFYREILLFQLCAIVFSDELRERFKVLDIRTE